MRQINTTDDRPAICPTLGKLRRIGVNDEIRTNLRIAHSYLSISGPYVGTIEPSIPAALISLPIGNSRLQGAGCARARSGQILSVFLRTNAEALAKCQFHRTIRRCSSMAPIFMPRP